jgi:hypothetical protein
MANRWLSVPIGLNFGYRDLCAAHHCLRKLPRLANQPEFIGFSVRRLSEMAKNSRNDQVNQQLPPGWRLLNLLDPGSSIEHVFLSLQLCRNDFGRQQRPR